jgi:hypothetical protein
MRFLRSIGITLVLALVGLGLVASTPSQADAQVVRWSRWNAVPAWNGGWVNPSWNSGFYTPLRRPFYVWPRGAWGWYRW